MAIAFPVPITSVEFLTVKHEMRGKSDTSSESDYLGSYAQSNLFRALCLVQAVSLGYILILQLIAPITYGPQIFDIIAFEAWLNIFYTIGLFCGICIHLYPTNTAVVSYIGFQSLISFHAMHKFLLDIHRDFDSFVQLGNDSYSKFSLMLWASIFVSNSVVLLSALFLLLQYIYAQRCNRKMCPEEQQEDEDENLQQRQHQKV